MQHIDSDMISKRLSLESEAVSIKNDLDFLYADPLCNMTTEEVSIHELNTCDLEHKYECILRKLTEIRKKMTDAGITEDQYKAQTRVTSASRECFSDICNYAAQCGKNRRVPIIIDESNPVRIVITLGTPEV